MTSHSLTFGRSILSRPFAVRNAHKAPAMDKTETSAMLTENSTQQATMEQYLTDIVRLREQMSRDQDEIDRSRARTQAMLDELAALTGRMLSAQP